MQAEIELAIDRGRIASGRRNASLAEVELELKRDRRSELFRLAKVIEHQTQAEPYLPSKSERGYDLSRSRRQLVHFAEPLSLPPSVEAIDAFRIIVAEGFDTAKLSFEIYRAVWPRFV